MARSGQSIQKQVQLSVFDNEPEARMAEQLLFQQGIPCVTKSLGGGPGLWGSAFNLPHGIYVHEGDATRAREVLGLQADGETNGDGSPPVMERRTNWVWVAMVIVVIATLILTGPALVRLLGG